MQKPSGTNYPLAFYLVQLSNSLLVFLDVKHLGDYGGGVHLFPFRTEKLSPLAQMVLG